MPAPVKGLVVRLGPIIAIAATGPHPAEKFALSRLCHNIARHWGANYNWELSVIIPMTPARLVLSALAGAAILALSACGGGDDTPIVSPVKPFKTLNNEQPLVVGHLLGEQRVHDQCVVRVEVEAHRLYTRGGRHAGATA